VAKTPRFHGAFGWVWFSTPDKQLAKAMGIRRKDRGAYRTILSSTGQDLGQGEAYCQALTKSLGKQGYRASCYTNLD
jgi:hypothetical protein